jgi:hypothetical protein
MTAYLKRLVAVLLVLPLGGLLTACATPAIDLSGSEYLVALPSHGGGPYDYRLVIVNKAHDTDTHLSVFGPNRMAVRVEEPPRETVEKDLERFFARALVPSEGTRRIVARIERAEAYWVNPAVNTIPFVGLISGFAVRYPFYFEVRVTFEVEEHGKVLRSFLFDEAVTLPDGDALTASAIEESYRRLIARYREVMVEALDHEFLPRYLDER